MLARGRTEFWSQLIEIETDRSCDQKKKARVSAGEQEEPGGRERLRQRGQGSSHSSVLEEAGGGERGKITQIPAKIFCCRSQGRAGLQAVHCGA